MERTTKPYVFRNIRETNMMNRSIALRKVGIFTSIIAAGILVGAFSHFSQTTLVISASLALLMLCRAATMPRPVTVPVRIKARR
jgi:hypothetical protein